MKNLPEVKTGIIAVSRDCFPIELSKLRKEKVVEECLKEKIPVTGLETIIEGEEDVIKALDEIRSKAVNALVIYLGNFGPEGPLTLLAEKFAGPVMMCAAAEESQTDLIHGRGDALCGLLSASYNAGLRNLKVHIPEYPVGIAPEISDMVSDFIPLARIVIGLKKLKIFAFGPRPQDFIACNAPIKPLYSLGIEIMENSELDLYDIYVNAAGDPDIEKIVHEMTEELGEGNRYSDLLNNLAQYEIALTRFYAKYLGTSTYGIFATKCWPTFQKYFHFVPCYVNSRLAAKGIPVACEVDIYGAVSQYMAAGATEKPAAILDINNTVPYDMIETYKREMEGKGYQSSDLWMGFHCGNVSCDLLYGNLNPDGRDPFEMKFQLIMHRLMEPDNEPDITRGTLEGILKPGKMTMLRLQGSADSKLAGYVAQGEILNMDPKSFGSIGVFAVPEMGRFYRYGLLENYFPHHTAIGFDHVGKTIYNAFKMLGVDDILYNLPKDLHYKGENPFSWKG